MPVPRSLCSSPHTADATFCVAAIRSSGLSLKRRPGQLTRVQVPNRHSSANGRGPEDPRRARGVRSALGLSTGKDRGDSVGVLGSGSPLGAAEAHSLLEGLVQGVRESGSRVNVVAFSGGVDSSLTAFLVHRAFRDTPGVVTAACVGRSPALASWQLQTAREVAHHIGITLWEVDTGEGDLPEYVANAGQSCFHCKTTLYSTLRAVAARARLGAPLDHPAPSTLFSAFVDPGTGECGGGGRGGEGGGEDGSVALFNGTNADDLKDPTRLGILAALHHNVLSPLAALPKQHVRALARAAGLPNSELAASPCLRSRLQLGVYATSARLSAVGALEHQVRQVLQLEPQESMRMRVLHSVAGMPTRSGDVLSGSTSSEHEYESDARVRQGGGPPGFKGRPSEGINAIAVANGVSTTKQGIIPPSESVGMLALGQQQQQPLVGLLLALEVETGCLERAENAKQQLVTLVSSFGGVYVGARQFHSGSVSVQRVY